MTTEVLAELRHVAATIRGLEVLSDISMSVRRGQSLGVVGETGSGKSMSCRIMSGMLRRLGGTIDAGEVIFEGRDVSKLSEREWRSLRGTRIGYIPQNSLASLNPVMTVGQQLRETLRRFRSRALPWSDEGELLEMVEMPDAARVLRYYPHQLSGGMRQRVAIALGMAGAPDLLIADEPTTALDVTVQREILDLILRLVRGAGRSLVLVTHDLSLVLSICEYVNVIYAGTTVESGAVSDVLRSPSHAYTAALLEAMPRTDRVGRQLASIPGFAPDPRAWPAGCRFAPRCAFAQVACRATEPVLRSDDRDGASRCMRATEKPWLTSL
jgi:oligopeptide/dipeptide ABC transporter ATP-binding protein